MLLVVYRERVCVMVWDTLLRKYKYIPFAKWESMTIEEKARYREE